jgi:putative redox protein
MSRTDVTISGAAGHELAGILHEPEGDIRGGVLFAHCFTCSKDYKILSRLGRRLEDAGYAVLRFDFTGLGESGGEFDETTFATNVADLVAAAEWMLHRGYGPCAMVGHSLGGSATLIAAGRIPAVRAVAVMGTSGSPAHLAAIIDPQGIAREEGRVVVRIGSRRFPITQEFIDDLYRYDAAETVAELGRPLLIIHSPDDRVVSVADAERLFALARQPKAFEPVPGAGHLLSGPNDADTVADILIGWLQRMM